jgi:hypothetical protein
MTTDWTTGVWSPADAKYFSSFLCLQASSEAHPASCTMRTGGVFLGNEVRLERDADHSLLSSAELKNVYEIYFLSPLSLHGGSETAFLFYLMPVYLYYIVVGVVCINALWTVR